MQSRKDAISLYCRPGAGTPASLDGKDWFAQMQLMLTIDYEGVSTEALYIRWLEEEDDTDHVSAHNKMPWLRWEQWSGKPAYDLISLKSVDGPAYIMEDPRDEWEGYFFYNKYICE